MKESKIGLGMLGALMISVVVYADTYIGLQGVRQLPDCVLLESYIKRQGYSVSSDNYFNGMIIQKSTTNTMFLFVALEKTKVKSAEYWTATAVDPLTCAVILLDVREVSDVPNEKIISWFWGLINAAISNTPVKYDYKTDSRPVIRHGQ